MMKPWTHVNTSQGCKIITCVSMAKYMQLNEWARNHTLHACMPCILTPAEPLNVLKPLPLLFNKNSQSCFSYCTILQLLQLWGFLKIYQPLQVQPIIILPLWEFGVPSNSSCYLIVTPLKQCIKHTYQNTRNISHTFKFTIEKIIIFVKLMYSYWRQLPHRMR